MTEETNELDDFLSSMGIDTKPETPEEEIISTIYNDEARRGTLSYYLRNELELLKDFIQDHTMPPQIRNVSCELLTKFLLRHYINTYLRNYFIAHNAGDAVPDKEKTVQLMFEQPYTQQIMLLAWIK